MNYAIYYKAHPQVRHFLSMASDGSLLHGEMLVMALGTPFNGKPGMADSVAIAEKILNDDAEIGLLIRGAWKPSAQQRFFGAGSTFVPPNQKIEPSPAFPSAGYHSDRSGTFYQYLGDKEKIWHFYGWDAEERNRITANWKPIHESITMINVLTYS